MKFTQHDGVSYKGIFYKVCIPLYVDDLERCFMNKHGKCDVNPTTIDEKTEKSM